MAISIPITLPIPTIPSSTDICEYFDTLNSNPDFGYDFNDHYEDGKFICGEFLQNNFYKRLYSFGKHVLPLKNTRLASYGFWHKNDPDNDKLIECTSCGLVINFSHISDVWAKHVNKYSRCRFIKSYINSNKDKYPFNLILDIPSKVKLKKIPDQISYSESNNKNTDILCITCCSTNRNALFQPCGHLVSCIECAKKIKDGTNKCCVCRTTITDIITTFMS